MYMYTVKTREKFRTSLLSFIDSPLGELVQYKRPCCIGYIQTRFEKSCVYIYIYTWLHVCITLEFAISLTANYFCITLMTYCRLSTPRRKRIKVTTDRTFNWYTDPPILPKKMKYFDVGVSSWGTYEHVEI